MDPRMNRDRWWKQFVEALNKAAPDMKLSDAVGFANQHLSERSQMQDAMDALLVLAIDVCGMNTQGDIKDEQMLQKMKESPRLQMAMSKALEIHAGWSVGITPGINKFLEWMDQEGESLRRQNKLSYKFQLDALEDKGDS